MKFLTKISCALLVCSAVICGTAAVAQDISTSLDVVYCSKYVWRGMAANLESAIQPSLTVSHSSGLSFNLWGSYDLTSSNGHKDKITEVDYTLGYSWKSASTAYSAGVIRYEFPNTAFVKTHEAYVSASFAAPLSPTVALNYDFDQADGLYANIGIGSSCRLSSSDSASSVNLSAKLGAATDSYNKFYFAGHDKAAFTDIYLGASMPMKSGKMTFTPSVAFTSILDGGLRDAYSRPDNLFVCLTASSPL